ncbi:MAG: hypothetical protein EBT20_18880 [Alphaproteobacteria bacterium]|nr:hypothetical protein [Alphaproteobacteria bacterium]
MIMSFRSFFCAMIIGSLGLASFAEGSEADLCDQSIEQVASTSVVPRDVIFKIARLESGRRIDGRHVSWPWSLNNGGKSYFLKDRATALSTLAQLKAQGKTNVDVGCMQLNIRWHADFFHSPEQMINPLDNVRYAARYLEQLYKETGSWEKAVKFYHSRNAKFNTIYYAKYKKMKPPNQPQMLASLSLDRAMPSLQTKSSSSQGTTLFWTGSIGALIQTGNEKEPSFAFADIRNFSVPPLLKM